MYISIILYWSNVCRFPLKYPFQIVHPSAIQYFQHFPAMPGEKHEMWTTNDCNIRSRASSKNCLAISNLRFKRHIWVSTSLTAPTTHTRATFKKQQANKQWCLNHFVATWLLAKSTIVVANVLARLWSWRRIRKLNEAQGIIVIRVWNLPAV